MSWLQEAAGGPAPPTYQDSPEKRKMKDPAIPGRMVTDKSANRPFLAYKEYREQQEALHAAWAERNKEREAKIARGEKVGPPEPDPTAQKEIGLLGLLKFFLYLSFFIALSGKFFTGSYTWEYESKWTQLKTYWPTNQRLFSERLLAEHDGSVPGRPVYLASVNHWKKFYAEHKDYVKIGRVSHRPIDPASPIPEHCNPKKEAAAQAARKTAKEKKNVGSDHKEL
ncbi:hypothetical protein C0995_002816 [Termitomyces sp. Mi166|nr:hypothetical protein C0995_002816 [Termitomyces sp. Mi166\